VSFRTKLLAMFTLTVVVVTVLVTALISSRARRTFERLDQQRAAGIVEQFRREFARRGAEISQRVESITSRDATVKIALALSGTAPDYSPYVSEAETLAPAHQLEFLELVAADGTLISSAQWPARFGYKEDWLLQPVQWDAQPTFLRREDLPEGSALALVAVRAARVNERNLYIVGGRKLDREFLASLVLPAGTRALLYTNLDATFSPQALTDAVGPVFQAEKLASLIATVQQTKADATEVVSWSGKAKEDESFHAIPLQGRQGELLGVLLLGTSRRELALLTNQIRAIALIGGLAGILLGIVLSGWAAARITRPVKRLAGAAKEVAAGDWNTRVEVESHDEVGQLAQSFNLMTKQLADQRERLVQAERVAAWRELARRLAHELKNPLFPLQITVENLLRARQQSPAQFEEVFQESTATLLAELANLKTIIARFSDFAKMPRPELRDVRVNDLVRDVLKLFEAQLRAPGRAPITSRLELDDRAGAIAADPELLHRALGNLVLNALDAMPSGGTLTLRTEQRPGAVRIEVSDTGTGLTKEECERLFTPYYTTKQHGTGLGLAIVQSVVSDHGGSISVQSAPAGSPARAGFARDGVEAGGTTFVIDLPEPPAAAET
jgi:signal transduction histidine kinase